MKKLREVKPVTVNDIQSGAAEITPLINWITQGQAKDSLCPTILVSDVFQA